MKYEYNTVGTMKVQLREQLKNIELRIAELADYLLVLNPQCINSLTIMKVQTLI